MIIMYQKCCIRVFPEAVVVSAESNDLGKRVSTEETESLDVVEIPNEKSDLWWQFGQQKTKQTKTV